MKPLLTLFFCFSVLLSLSYGQNISFQVEGGINLTHLSSFKNRIAIVDQGFVVPGILSPTNAKEPPFMALSEASTSVAPGYFVNVEAYYNQGSKWEFSSAVGLDLWRYSYDNSISSDRLIFSDIPDNIDQQRLNALESESLSALSGSFGEIETFYIEVHPFNVSYKFFEGWVSLKTGPVVSFQINNNHEDIAIRYNQGSEHSWEEMDDVYFSSIYQFHDVLPGWQLGLQGEVLERLSAFISAKYYFSPSFDPFKEQREYIVMTASQDGYVEQETINISDKGPLPLQFRAGISYDVWRIKKQD
ncbi:MAG: hypothetical protein U5L09_20260 [Bacteroidales bacterium]|nr:hypothetical protein [Bacteroidales bacterium]